jgi:hypothetical protein
MAFPIIFEHMDACGISHGRKVKSPAVSATAVLLTSLGVDQILMPCPSTYEEERTLAGIDRLPTERKGLVKIVDKHGETLGRIRSYLEPLRKQAQKWPETAFVAFAEDFLYRLGLAMDFEAGILGNAAETLRTFVPILDARAFKGEAKFRLAEIASLICSYEPNLMEHGAFQTEVASQDKAKPSVWNFIEMTEFVALVAASGRLGYLRHPNIGMRRVRKAAREFFGKAEVAKVFRLVSTTADLAGAKFLAEKAKGLIELFDKSTNSSFHPPFINLGAAEMGVYQAALTETFPDATPPPGLIMAFEGTRGGKASLSWLNIGEEMKLELEEQGMAHRVNKLQEARSALKRLA